jgi:Lon protease-like protein
VCYDLGAVKNIVDTTLNFPSCVPVMVLPNALLMPHVLLPLHIFEPRYREMLSLALDRERMFCIALMKPGVSEANSTDDFFHVAGLGLIRACTAQPDGTSHLILQGLTRVELVSFVQERPFRIAEIREVKSEITNPVEAEALSAKVLELSRAAQENFPEFPETLARNLDHLTDPGMLADIITHVFVPDSLRQQELLAQPSVSERLRALIQYLRRE